MYRLYLEEELKCEYKLTEKKFYKNSTRIRHEPEVLLMSGLHFFAMSKI